MTTTNSKKGQRDVISNMEKAAKALESCEYFKAEELASRALQQAHTMHDYDTMARIILPLQEARRQLRLEALDTGNITILKPDQDIEQVKIKPGCILIEPPNVGADGRFLRESATKQQIPLLLIVREPLTQQQEWPLVMISPVTVRAYVDPPKKLTADWFARALESLGESAIEQVDASLAASVRVTRLLERLGTVPESEFLHQALEAACKDAIKEQAELDADNAESNKKQRSRGAA